MWLLPVTGTSACGGSLLFPPHPNSVRKCAALTKKPVRPLPQPTTPWLPGSRPDPRQACVLTCPSLLAALRVKPWGSRLSLGQEDKPLLGGPAPSGQDHWTASPDLNLRLIRKHQLSGFSGKQRRDQTVLRESEAAETLQEGVRMQLSRAPSRF